MCQYTRGKNGIKRKVRIFLSLMLTAACVASAVATANPNNPDSGIKGGKATKDNVFVVDHLFFIVLHLLHLPRIIVPAGSISNPYSFSIPAPKSSAKVLSR